MRGHAGRKEAPGRGFSLKTLLAIGGHDPSNGAGITKDLEVFSVCGCHGVSVPTSFVNQGPEGVSSVDMVPLGVFAEMLQRVGDDFPLGGVKIGALGDDLHVEVTAEFLAACVDAPVVLDPVVAAKNGSKLITDEGVDAIVGQLLPLTTCLTPNLEEAQLLLGKKIVGVRGMERAAKALAAMGPGSVVIKGGHLEGDPVDVLFDGADIVTYGKKRVDRNVHGTGCIFSSCLLSFLARGYPMRDAFFETELEMEKLIEASVQPREEGYYYSFPGIGAGEDARKWSVIRAMVDAAERLKEGDMAELVPASGMAVGYAVPGALGSQEVASFPGGIILRQGLLHTETPEFGKSPVAEALCLACMKRYPSIRAAATVKYDPVSVEKAQKGGLTVIRLDERIRPAADNSTIEAAIERAAGPPDIVYDHGDQGHEPLIRLFARTPHELIKKMEIIRPCTTN
jgi:hydroxymethylpyrimidine/phosphomethylpyrimidine kinase